MKNRFYPSLLKAGHGLSLVAAFSLAFGIFSSAVAGETPKESAKLLTIGNSFANDVLRQLPQIAEAGGKKLVFARTNLGGCTLERHAKHLKQALAGDPEGSPYSTFEDPTTGEKKKVSLPEALKATQWDFVTIQQASPSSFRPETYQPHANELVAAIRENAPGAEILIHQTWAWRSDDRRFQEDEAFSQEVMYEKLRANYRSLAKELQLRLLPVGDAFQQARQSPNWQYRKDPNFDFKNPPAGALPNQDGSLIVGYRWAKKDGQETFGLDSIHANTAGSYLGAGVWYLMLFNEDKIPESYCPQGLTQEQAAELRSVAEAIVAKERTSPAAAPAN